MSKHSDFHLNFFQIVGVWRDFTVVTKLMKNFKCLYGFGGRCFKIRDVCMYFKLYFKVHNLVSIHPKSITLGQMINLVIIFHLMVSVYRLVKIWNSPQFPGEFRNGLFRFPLVYLSKLKSVFQEAKQRSAAIHKETNSAIYITLMTFLDWSNNNSSLCM